MTITLSLIPFILINILYLVIGIIIGRLMLHHQQAQERAKQHSRWMK